jgi:hypothetical protein
MRDLWQVTNVKRGANLGWTIPKRFKTNGIRKLMDRALWEQGIRLSPEKHHPFKMTHGFRKYFMSHAEQSKVQEIHELKENIRSMQQDMNDVFEVLRIVKRNDGRVGTDKTVLDENRNFTIYQDYENTHGLRQTVGVKIPIDAVEVEEFQSTRP